MPVSALKASARATGPGWGTNSEWAVVVAATAGIAIFMNGIFASTATATISGAMMMKATS